MRLHETRTMRHAMCNVQRATCNMQHVKKEFTCRALVARRCTCHAGFVAGARSHTRTSTYVMLSAGRGRQHTTAETRQSHFDPRKQVCLASFGITEQFTLLYRSAHTARARSLNDDHPAYAQIEEQHGVHCQRLPVFRDARSQKANTCCRRKRNARAGR